MEPQTQTARAPSAFLERVAPYAASAVFVILFYSPVIFAGGRILTGDFQDFFFPYRYYATKALHDARLPFWMTELFAGYPFLSDPQSAFFYPGNLLLALLSGHDLPVRSMELYCILHCVVMAMGGVFLARCLGLGRWGALTVGVIVSLNGHNVNRFAMPAFIETIAVGLWALGALVLAVRHLDRRWAVTAGLLLGASVLVGSPQMAMFLFYTAGFGGLFLAMRWALAARSAGFFARAAAMMSLVFILAGLTSAAQLVPTFRLLANTDRVSIPRAEAMMFPLPAELLPGLFFPSLYKPFIYRTPPSERWLIHYCTWGGTGSYEYLVCIGFVAFALGLYGWIANFRRGLAQALFWASVLLLICALGEKGCLYTLLWHYFPGVKQQHVPSRLLWLPFTSWGLLAGMGVDALFCKREGAGPRRANLIAAAVIALLLAAGLIVLLIAWRQEGSRVGAFVRLFVFNPGVRIGVDRMAADFVTDVTHQIVWALGIGAFCVVWLVLAKTSSARLRVVLAAAAVAAVIGELSLHGFLKNVVYYYDDAVNPVAPMYRALPFAPSGRVLRPSPGVWSKNTGIVAGVDYAGGYNPIELRWVTPFKPEEDYTLGRRDLETNEDLWNVSHLVFARRDMLVNTGGTPRNVIDAKWVCASSGDERFPRKLAWDFVPAIEPRRIGFIATVYGALGQPDGTVIARITTHGASGVARSTHTLLLGRDVSEWDHDRPDRAARPAHARANAACVNPIDPSYPKGAFYSSFVDAPGTMPVTRIEVDVTAPGQVYLYISHLVIETADGRMETRLGLEGLGHRLAASRRPDQCVVERARPMGYCWMAPVAITGDDAMDTQTTIKLLSSPWFNPRKTVIINDSRLNAEKIGGLNAPRPDVFSGKTTSSRTAPEKFAVDTDSGQPGWLVLSRAWHPDWQAAMDGAPVPMLRANGAFCAVPVPAGKHTVSFAYNMPCFAAGVWVTGITWIAAIGFLFVSIRRTKRIV
ncbi:MAG: YfhO family protein [bacterium]